MNALSCTFAQLLVDLVNIYTIVLLIYAVVSWIPDLRGAWVRYLAALVEPLLLPIRRIIPPVGGLDLAFLALILLLQLVVSPLLHNLVLNVCY